MAQDKFMFFPNFKAMADKLDSESRLAFYDALTDYVFFDKEPSDPIISALIEAIKPSLNKIDGRRNNGGNHNPNGVNQHSKSGQSGQIRSKLVNSGQFLSETETEEETETKEKELSSDNSKKKVCEETVFNAGFQNWKFDPALLKVAKKHWTSESIRAIERDFSCNEYNTETNIADLLERYPSDKVPFKILGEKQTIALTKKQWDWFQSQGIAPAVKIKAIDLLEDYSFSNPKRFKEYTDLSIIIGRSTGWAYKEAFKDPYVFENQEHLMAELKRVGLR